MDSQWLRLLLSDEFAEVARSNPDSPELDTLTNILRKHDAAMKSQSDAFSDYVREAEQQGIDNYPLYKWTKATIENPAKKEKYLKSFTVYMEGNEVYAKEEADALEAELKPLVSGKLIKQLKKYDTNPANTPQPPKRYRRG